MVRVGGKTPVRLRAYSLAQAPGKPAVALPPDTRGRRSGQLRADKQRPRRASPRLSPPERHAGGPDGIRKAQGAI